MDTLSYMQNDANSSVTPLPAQGEGGAMTNGGTSGPSENYTPVIPLPNPGEGGPVAGPSEDNTPALLLPNPGEGWPIPDFSPSIPNMPSTPTPSIPSRPSGNGIWGSIITVFPRPIIPCYFCNTNRYGVVRFLNAAAGYNPFLIYINNQLVVTGLDNAEVSEYGRVSSSSQTVTVSGQNGYVYLQKQINVPMNGALTVAIINTNTGLDLQEITDMNCNAGVSTGCFRVCNLSNTNRSVNVSLNGGAVMFRNVEYREVTSFRYLSMGYYTVSVSNNSSFTGNALVTSNIYVRGNVSYTLYIFNWNNSTDAIRTLIVEDRRN